ncbi:MAG: hypothetical protein COB67_04230 [SAR324 cluster bacterium]|uniref:Glycosyltransferase family 1 protein n=1 Tax=SAR324 cluster bacterium TaxID=2024889 RepID=A0A2A4T8N5_9DELT|nr:MAG: hypothetical protein COB67_04230 [SAR324 cluster bacterium]
MALKTILFIESGSSGYGGSFQSLRQTVQVLDKKKYKLIIIFLNHSPLIQELTELGIDCRKISDPVLTNHENWSYQWIDKIYHNLQRIFPNFSLLTESLFHFSTIRKLKRIVTQENVDLVHLNNQVSRDFWGTILAKKCDLPCVSHLRTFNSQMLNKRKVDYLKKVNISYIAISSQIKKHWQGKGLPHEKLTLIHNIFIPAPWKAEQKSQIQRSEEGKKILFIGRLIQCKGLPFFLEAFALLLHEMPRCRLYLIGSGQLENHLKELTEQLHLQESVYFLGYQDKPYSLIAEADLLVLPSSQEAFGRVLLEAMTLGTPVIGSDIGGISDIIESETDGLIIPYGNVEALKNAMQRILTDEELSTRLKKNAIKKVQKKFNSTEYATKLQAIYTNILN